jgi:hypothetical protein
VATVTVVDADRTLEIEATSIVSGLVNDEGHLILTRHDGTELDMGAVSGMQLDNGTAYSKVDAFTYVGDTDPGTVPDGSVWLDTTDVAGPFASSTQKGLVELATNAETISGTDNSRAVTPASLASVPGNKVQILAPNANTESAAPSAYPDGISQMNVTTGSGYSVGAGFGTLTMYKIESDRSYQTFVGTDGGTRSSRMWMRTHHSTLGGGGWTAWQQVQQTYTLTPGTIVQTTSLTAYPNGTSRMYFTTANGTGWDFAGKAGELVTYNEGNEFARQEWTKHVGGTSAGVETERWIRTATAAGGWSRWRVLVRDAKLPDPQATKASSTYPITATAWADHPGIGQVSLSLAYDAIVQVEYGAWLTAAYTDTTSVRSGVSLDGAAPEDLFGGTWGNVLYLGTQATSPAGGQHSFTATGRLSAGNHTFKPQAYKTGSANTLVNYPVLRVTPLRWAD